MYLRYLEKQCFLGDRKRESFLFWWSDYTISRFAIQLLGFEHDAVSHLKSFLPLLINTRRYERRPNSGKNEINEPQVTCDRKFSKKYIED